MYCDFFSNVYKECRTLDFAHKKSTSFLQKCALKNKQYKCPFFDIILLTGANPKSTGYTPSYYVHLPGHNDLEPARHNNSYRYI